MTISKLFEKLSGGKNLAYFNCSCGHKLYVDEVSLLLSEEYEDELRDAADNNFNSVMDYGIKNPNFNIAELVVSVDVCCPQCEAEFTTTVLVEFDYYHEEDKMTTYVDTVRDFVLIDISEKELLCEEGLKKGKDILQTIRWLIFRWSITSEKVYIVSPFIDKSNWLFIEGLHSSVLDQINVKGRIEKVITRQTQLEKGRYFNMKKHLANEVRIREEKCEEQYKLTGIDCANPDSKCGHYALKSIFNKVSFEKKRFHAKLYAGLMHDFSEVIITSFNLLTSELEQEESFSLIKMDSQVLVNQVNNINQP